MNENINPDKMIGKDNDVILDENITDKQIKFFSGLFSQVPKKIITNVGVREIYDIATQYFVYGSTSIPIYGAFEYKTIINKIVKTVRGDFLPSDKISDKEIDEFRKYFYKNPEFQEVLKQNFYEGTELKMFNEFLKYTIEYKILRDENLNGIREIRQYIYFSDKAVSNTGNLKHDLYNFLNFGRFKKDGYLPEQDYMSVLDNIVSDIQSGKMENPLEYKIFKDRNGFPNKHLEAIEKLVLKNYSYDPIKRTTKKETCDAINQIDLGELKKALAFDPRGWQRYYIIHESREGLAANCRRTGKSFLAVYLAIRQIMLPQQLVLYILPNKEGFSEQPFFYIEKMFDNLKSQHGIEGNIPGLQFNNKTFKVTNKELKSKILFISSQGGTKGGRSFSANFIIMDEAGYNDDADIYDISYSATTDTRGRMFALSTINKDTPINWFFYKKIDLEGGDDSIVVVVDIYNNEFIPDEEKTKLERTYKVKNPKIWLSEYMAIFVGQGDTFDISGFFRLDFDYDVLKFGDFSFRFSKKLDKYTKFIIGRDPGRDTDPAGVCVIGIKNRNEADVLATGYMRVPNYIIQKAAIVELFNFLRKMRDTIIVLDVGKAGIGMFDLMNSEQIYPYGVQSTATGVINVKSPRLYNIGNNVLEGNLKNIMNTGLLKGFSWLDSIRHEYETFEASKTREGTKHHHDILSSLMIAATIGLERNFISFRKEVSEKENPEDVLDDFFGTNKTSNNTSSKYLY